MHSPSTSYSIIKQSTLPQTADNIFYDVSKSKYIQRQLDGSINKVRDVFLQLCYQIQTQLRLCKGILLPELGTFYVQLAHQESTTRALNRASPGFELIPTRYGGVSQDLTVPKPRDARVAQINYSIIASNVALHRASCQRVVREILQRIAVYIVAGYPLAITFPGVGTLRTSKAGRIMFEFDSELVNNLQQVGTPSQLDSPDQSRQASPRHKEQARHSTSGASTPPTPPSSAQQLQPQSPQHARNGPVTGQRVDQVMASLRELCARADRTKAGWVPRITFERWLRGEGRPLAAKFDAPDLLEILDMHSCGPTGERLTYAPLLEALKDSMPSWSPPPSPGPHPSARTSPYANLPPPSSSPPAPYSQPNPTLPVAPTHAQMDPAYPQLHPPMQQYPPSQQPQHQYPYTAAPQPAAAPAQQPAQAQIGASAVAAHSPQASNFPTYSPPPPSTWAHPQSRPAPFPLPTALSPPFASTNGPALGALDPQYPHVSAHSTQPTPRATSPPTWFPHSARAVSPNQSYASLCQQIRNHQVSIPVHSSYTHSFRLLSARSGSQTQRRPQTATPASGSPASSPANHSARAGTSPPQHQLYPPEVHHGAQAQTATHATAIPHHAPVSSPQLPHATWEGAPQHVVHYPPTQPSVPVGSSGVVTQPPRHPQAYAPPESPPRPLNVRFAAAPEPEHPPQAPLHARRDSASTATPSAGSPVGPSGGAVALGTQQRLEHGSGQRQVSAREGEGSGRTPRAASSLNWIGSRPQSPPPQHPDGTYYSQSTRRLSTRAECDQFNEFHFHRLKESRGDTRMEVAPKVTEEPLNVEEMGLAVLSRPGSPSSNYAMGLAAQVQQRLSAAQHRESRGHRNDVAGLVYDQARLAEHKREVAAKRAAAREMLRQSWEQQQAEKARLASILQESEQQWPYTLPNAPHLKLPYSNTAGQY